MSLSLLSLLMTQAFAASVTQGKMENRTKKKPIGKTIFTTKLSLKGLMVEGQNINSKVSGFEASLNGENRLTKNLTANLSAGLSLETGSNDSLFVQEYAPEQSLKLSNASLTHYSFQRNVELEFGAINQGIYNNPLLLTDTAFVGARQSALMEGLQFFARLEAQQSIANNHSLGQRLGSIDEGTPSFFQERIYLGYDADGANRLETYIGRFAFDSLSNSVAHQSRFSGNSVVGLSENAEFKYDHKGWNAGAELILNREGKVIPKGFAHYVFNEAAPDGKNSGTLYGLETTFITSNETQVNLRASLFENQSDSSVSFYNSSDLGHNNTKGQAISLGVFYPKTSLYVTGKYIQREVLEKNNFQDDSNVIELKIGKGL